MNNLKASMKKFLGNKNTVTILGIIVCLVVLYIGYNYRINSKVELVQVPYAINTIQPRTYIKKDMIDVNAFKNNEVNLTKIKSFKGGNSSSQSIELCEFIETL